MSQVTNIPIDAVITWVDGNDPAHQKKMNQYLPDTKKKSFSTDPTRFAAAGEIKYCVSSILHFAPFVRKIFIVTDNQDPQLDAHVQKVFPNRSQDVVIIDHQVIFEGYEQFLPTFNSSSIENMLWRIPGLSENFIYFNDDIFLIQPVNPEDFFQNNTPVLRGSWLPSAAPRHAIRKLRMKLDKNYIPKPSYNVKQWLTAHILGFKWRFFAMDHTPYVMKKSTLEKFYTKYPDLLKSNISYKFRFHTQFNVASIVNHTSLKEGNFIIKNPNIAYLQPSKRKEGYLERKLDLCDRNKDLLFLCVQNLDQVSLEKREYLWSWLEGRFKNLTS
ncbi:Stealth CR1 domain-containing protein [Mongoliitalea lutea]|uniref:Capsular biosynthesis protein n=1 Tax=Mongoliitalea lutea TaxID=849756 RepID=A0A8J3G6H3_9BACT|nr:Stealth CR1 domain-containing protein [Mongoliitalea lutea]GHB44759.1 hypothetical protein GCM10008106_27300 [Mongoliitalea lutea]